MIPSGWRAPAAKIVAACALVACGSGTGDRTVGPGDTGGGTTVVVATVTVAPDTIHLFPGDTSRLTFSAKDSAGSTLTGRTPTWQSGAPGIATVNPIGLVTAVAMGTTQVRVTVDGVSDTATVVVAAPVTTECATPQAGWIWCDDFEQDRLSSYFEYDAAGGAFTRVAGVGHNGTYGMRGQFQVGSVSVGALHLAIGKTPQAYIDPVDAGTQLYRDVYWRMYLRHQPGWQGGGGHKLSRAFVFASTNSFAQAMIAHVWAGSSPNQNYLYIEPASGTDTLGNLITTTYNDFAHLRFLGPVKGITPIFDAAHVGEWYCIEAHARLNDPGMSNGIEELWIDGLLQARRSDLNYLGSFNAYGINAVYLENYWNSPGSPAVQERYFDRFIVSTQRIGC